MIWLIFPRMHAITWQTNYDSIDGLITTVWMCVFFKCISYNCAHGIESILIMNLVVIKEMRASESGQRQEARSKRQEARGKGLLGLYDLFQWKWHILRHSMLQTCNYRVQIFNGKKYDTCLISKYKRMRSNKMWMWEIMPNLNEIYLKN